MLYTLAFPTWPAATGAQVEAWRRAWLPALCEVVAAHVTLAALLDIDGRIDALTVCRWSPAVPEAGVPAPMLQRLARLALRPA